MTPFYPLVHLRQLPAVLTTWVANRMEWLLYWLANRSVAVARGFTSYRITYREELSTSSLKAQRLDVLAVKD